MTTIGYWETGKRHGRHARRVIEDKSESISNR